jgi:diguanylate cyclase (GGDEF)-like protein
MYGIAKDITQRKRMEGQLAHQAFHDPLTTLPNRTFFLEQLTRALARAKRQQTSVAVLFVDLDRFKVINDSLGHPVGDQLLITVAERLQACVRVGDTVARLGGDEFTLLLEALPTVQGAMEVAERIHTALQAPFPLDGRNVFTSASIGIALSMPETDHPDDLLRAADSAMYQAKVAGKAQFALFDPHHTTAVQERLDLETALRYAIARDELRVEYQPIVQLTTGWVVGVEALVRWMHPQHGLLPPARFIPIAEETGQIRAIGRWVLEQACRQVRAWHTVRPSAAPLMLTVNLSAREFQHLDLVDDLYQLVQDTGFDPTTLTLELTESVTMQDAAATIGTLHKLKALGVRIAIDDFGTGYSSLAYLKRFPITTVKIDRSFVREIPSDPNDAAIVTAIIAMAHQLHLHVVAEGVETPAQYAFLQAHGCDALQGYLISRPLPAEQVLPLLQRGPWLLPAAAGSTSAQDREPSTGGGRTSRHTARGEWTWG